MVCFYRQQFAVLSCPVFPHGPAEPQDQYLLERFDLCPMYFFYRKMWGWGAISLALSILFSVPSYLAVFQSAGLPIGSILSASALEALALICFVLNFASSVFFALYAFYLYRRHALKKLQALQKVTASPVQMVQSAQHEGGTSVLGVIFLFALVVTLNSLIVSAVGPTQMMNYFYG